MEISNLLQKIGFSTSLIQQIVQFGNVKTFSTGTKVFHEKSYSPAVPLVLKGTLKITRTEPDGRELLLYYVSSGESCVMSFLGGINCETNKVNAEIEDEAELLFLPIQKVTEWIKQYPEWQNFIFQQYHNRFEELLNIVNEIAFKKIDERLWVLLQKKSKLTGDKLLHTTHEQLANELGTSRVVISRLLKQLEEEGKVQLSRNKIEINDTIK